MLATIYIFESKSIKFGFHFHTTFIVLLPKGYNSNCSMYSYNYLKRYETIKCLKIYNYNAYKYVGF